MGGIKETVVLYPAAGIGHLTPMVELAKLFISHGFAVTVVLVHSPNKHDPNVAAFVNRVTSVHPAISFHKLPPVTAALNPNPFVSFFQALLLCNPLLRDFLDSLRRPGAAVRALVLDMFCTMAFDVAAELHIPAYLFYTSAASSLAAYLYGPTLLLNSAADLKDLGDAPVHFPGLPPVPASHIPRQFQDRSSEACKVQIYHSASMARADGILVNTFESLQTRAVRALTDGLCLPAGRTKMPPLYCIGPLITNGRGGEEKKHECLSWLDEQPKASVVFLCFGSWGSFSGEQIKETAAGLEQSGQRFLWVAKSSSEPDFINATALPEGFLERTKGRGLVVQSWAPQVEVLGHEAVGGFVSHCGWNSTLEAICAGVPMVAWPLHAEQRLNKVLLVEEMRLAVAMEGYDRGLVSAGEVAAKVRWLVESDGGKELRERTRAAKESAAAAWRGGGSSHAAWLKVVEVLKGGDA